MPGAASFSVSDIPRNNRKAKTTGFFPNHEPCSEAVTAVFCCGDFWRARFGDIATCDAPHRRNARTLRLLDALGKFECKCLAGSSWFFAVLCVFATPLLEGRGQARKSAG